IKNQLWNYLSLREILMNNIAENYIHTYSEKCYSIRSNMFNFLNHSTSIDVVYNKIRTYYENINREFNHIKEFEVGLVSTESVISEPWFYDPKYYSEKAIEISQNDEKKHVWLSSGEWECERFNDNEMIAICLSSWTCFDFPKSMKSMLRLIKEGYWLLKPSLPVLSEKNLIDINEVLSWDDKYVLTGTSIENIDVITIEHWERIVKNEAWFESE
ncbi:MAG TPA: hypothetical protein VF941_00725, partial [Clostridia bacterium]